MSNNNNETPSPEQILSSISAMRDSVWVINSEMEKSPSKESIQTIQRNIAHLELQISNEHIISFGEDLSDVTEAINVGKLFEEEHKSLLIEQ
jgi:hypothetical protein